MGRMKIKKKETTLPFRQTMAYRMMLLTLSILFFIFTLYEMVTSLSANNTLAFIMSAVVGVGAAIAVFYTLDHLRDGRVPATTMKRMRRR
jgi:polyferredoxin